MAFKLSHRHELGPLATFKPNKELPRHRWFYFKEGFSRDLVYMLLDHFGLSGGTVLDPFCGSGTTLLACRERGIGSIGIDASPLAVFVSRVKTVDYDIGELRKEDERLWKLRTSPMEIPRFNDPIVKRAFPPGVLWEILAYKAHIDSIDDETARSFFLFALMTAGIKSSFAFKDGAVLKLEKRPLPPLRQSLKRQVFKMLRDVEALRLKAAKCVSNVGDARMLGLNEDVDAVITSPPYLNKIEYTNIYRIELELFLETSSEPQLRSYVGKEGKTYDKFSHLPVSAQSYFSDMEMSIKGLGRALKPGGKASIIIGNACYPDEGVVVNSDEVLAGLAEEAGLKVNEIVCLNERWCTKARTEKVAQVRESIVLLEK